MTGEASGQALAREALESVDGIVPDAVDALYQRLINDKTLLAVFLPAMVRAWCASMVGTATSLKRASSWKPQAPQHNAARLNAAIRTTLMSFPLPKGKRLGDASKDDLQDAIGHYSRISDDAAWKGRWLSKIATAIGNAHRVEDVMTEDQLQSLQNETE